MKAQIRRFNVDQPTVPFTGETNRCPACGNLPKYTRSNCGGYHLGCQCHNIRTANCTDNLTREKANLLREEWNEMILSSSLSQLFVDKLGAENGSLCLIRSEDSAIISVHADIIDPLAFLQKECKRDSSIDYDLCQFVRRRDGSYFLAHIGTSKILSFVGQWEGFDFESMIAVD